jgi:hypothetical protein
VAHGFGINVTGRQNIEPQQMRQKARTSGVFDAVILLDSQGIGQMYRITFILETIDQPVPVVGGLNHNTADVILVRHQMTMYILKLIVQTSFTDDWVFIVNQGNHTVIAVQVYSAVEFHKLSPSVEDEPF